MPRPELVEKLVNDEMEWVIQKDFNFWRSLYHKVFFETQEGQAVFHDLLKELCYFKTVQTEEEKYLSNFSKKLLSWCGELSMTMDPPKDCVVDKNGYPAQPSIRNDALKAGLTGRNQ